MVDFDGILSKVGLERLIKKAKIFEMKGCGDLNWVLLGCRGGCLVGVRCDWKWLNI